MKMQIDFYSKDEMAIQLDFSGRYPFPENEASELFLLACFTIRQLNNLGEHPVPKALAALLVSEHTISNLLQGKVEFPSGNQLSSYLKYHVGYVLQQTLTAEEAFNVLFARDNELSFDKPIIKILDTDFLSKTPDLVKYNGNSKKRFEVTLPPFLLSAGGFGFLGRDVPYYAFHSVIGLIRFLGQKHRDDKNFLTHTTQVAQLCGSAYIFKQIPADQVSLANAILKQVGIS